jgi:hypothetical protein
VHCEEGRRVRAGVPRRPGERARRRAWYAAARATVAGAGVGVGEGGGVNRPSGALADVDRPSGALADVDRSNGTLAEVARRISGSGNSSDSEHDNDDELAGERA